MATPHKAGVPGRIAAAILAVAALAAALGFAGHRQEAASLAARDGAGLRRGVEERLAGMRAREVRDIAAGRRGAVPAQGEGLGAGGSGLLGEAEAARREILVVLDRLEADLRAGPLGSGTPRALRAAADALAASSSSREDALRIELLDAAAHLAAGRFARAEHLLGGIAAEGAAAAPGSASPDVPALLAAAREGRAAAERGARLAEAAAEALRGAMSRGDPGPLERWRLEARAWCAAAARRGFASIAAAPRDAAELGRLASQIPALRDAGQVALGAYADLAAWAGAAVEDAARSGDATGALALLDGLAALLGEEEPASTPGIARLRSRLLEERGRAALERDPERAAGDVAAAAHLRLQLAADAEPGARRRLAVEAAGLLDLAGDPRGVLEALPAPELDDADAVLLVARARAEAGDPRGAAALLDAAIERGAAWEEGTWASGLGPAAEEARLLRAAVRLEMASDLAARDPGEALALDSEAGRDLVLLIENLDAASAVCRAALLLRALQLERRALEDLSRAAGRRAAPEAAAQLELAGALLERWLAAPGSRGTQAEVVALDRLWRIEERLGRRERAWASLEELAGLEPRSLAPDRSRLRGLFRLSRTRIEDLAAGAAYRLADATLESGDAEGALRRYERALSLHGEGPLAPWARLRIAEIVEARGERERGAAERSLARAALGGLADLSAREPAAGAWLRKWRSALASKLEGER
ncbi:MAG: hypothetical protein HY721_09165 [Planctomycetes bacterium]|nr:hypothetical protein [Planctomycetota bacterium]